MLCPACDAVRFPTAETEQATRQVKSNKNKATTKTAEAQCAENIDTQTTRLRSSGGENQCPRCLLEVSSTERWIKCDICVQHYHQRCSDMSIKTFDKYLTLVDVTGWVCAECKQSAQTSFSRLNSAVSRLTEEIADIRTELEKMKSMQSFERNINTEPLSQQQIDNTIPSSSPDDDEREMRTTLIIERTLNDAAKRRSNVVIIGLPEDNRHGDRHEFLQLCENNLSVKPAVAERDCIRLGKKMQGKPRKMLIRLRSEDLASSLLHEASRLRNSTDPYIAANVYINQDLSPAAAKLAYEDRVKRREAKKRRKHEETGAKEQNTEADYQQQIPRFDIINEATNSAQPTVTLAAPVLAVHQSAGSHAESSQAAATDTQLNRVQSSHNNDINNSLSAGVAGLTISQFAATAASPPFQ